MSPILQRFQNLLFSQVQSNIFINAKFCHVYMVIPELFDPKEGFVRAATAAFLMEGTNLESLLYF